MEGPSRHLVEFILLGPTHDRRQIQDSPVLGDVWAAYALAPHAAVDLLLSPYKTQAAGPCAKLLAGRIRAVGMEHGAGEEAHVAYLQGLVAARLYFPEVIRAVVPLTMWWKERKVRARLEEAGTGSRLEAVIEAVVAWAGAEGDERTRRGEACARFTALERYVALTALILLARERPAAQGGLDALLKEGVDPAAGVKVLDRELKEIRRVEEAGPKAEDVLGRPGAGDPALWQVSLNRRAMLALEKSRLAVKGDAATSLFQVKCDAITWAVLDSGIDGSHPAFLAADGQTSRVKKAFDFRHIRRIVDLDNEGLDPTRPKDLQRIRDLLPDPEDPDVDFPDLADKLDRLARDAGNDRPIDWGLVEALITIDPKTPPGNGHGTHVAGILGARADTADPPSHHAGMCADIQLYDFRVLGRTLEDTEFAIIAALQFIRYLNERNNYITIHGANLSLSIPHDVRNFACGRTPICNECERLVESGVVVVAAAGNMGYQSYETKDGSYDGYTAFSITDPGNAESVITVGATHRFWPHTYGVSFFSSRGPTGDGRLKPDLVAPGERVGSCLPGGDWGEMDGTSMAAPHVSGAAALLMGRYSELIGQPRRIKRLLCETATDLARERTFQGHGMLDVLRAFQHM